MQWVRQGTISSINAGEMTVRVVFNGLDKEVSSDLDILIPPSRVQVYQLPEIGDTVICVFSETQGFCVGTLQSATPEMQATDWGIVFDENNQITFVDGKLSVKASELSIEAAEIKTEGKLKIVAPEINITGKMSISSHEVLIDGNLKITGTINDIVPGSGDL
jgi:phage baseplate assembly protein gpV